MARRIPVSAIVAPRGIYQRQALAATGYRPSANSRFAVVRTSPDAPWLLLHLASGGSVDSILPAKSYALTMTHKLAVAAAFEAMTSHDWSDFDTLPPVTLETTEAPGCKPSPMLRERVNEMSRIARNALDVV